MLTRLSAMTPRPTQRFMPASPLYRLRSSPCRRLTTLMRPSHPVRHFCPLRNQRFFCSRLRSGLLVERLGMQTRLTPFAFTAISVPPPRTSYHSERFLLSVRADLIEMAKAGTAVTHAMAQRKLAEFNRTAPAPVAKLFDSPEPE